MSLEKRPDDNSISNDPLRRSILDTNPDLDTNYLVKVLRTTDHQSIEILYCDLDEHDHDIDRLEILIDLSNFWLILDAKSKLEDPDWYGQDDSDAYVGAETDLTEFTANNSITFKFKHNNGNLLSIAVYDYNTMELKMAKMRIDPLIDPSICIKDNIIKWIRNNQYFIENIVYPIDPYADQKRKQQAIVRAIELKKQQS